MLKDAWPCVAPSFTCSDRRSGQFLPGLRCLALRAIPRHLAVGPTRSHRDLRLGPRHFAVRSRRFHWLRRLRGLVRRRRRARGSLPGGLIRDLVPVVLLPEANGSPLRNRQGSKSERSKATKHTTIHTMSALSALTSPVSVVTATQFAGRLMPGCINEHMHRATKSNAENATITIN